MKLRHPLELTPDKNEARDRAIRLEAVSLVVLILAAFLIYLTLGQSQAMKTAWVSDLLALIPPIAFLVASRFELRPPNERYPFGYTRSMSVAFLITAVLLLIVGVWLLYDAVMKLLRGERPAIGTAVLFGRQFWLGYAMMGALATTVVASFILGKRKSAVAEPLHSKVLEADADMNKADWTSEGAAIVGIALVGFGLWWGDAVAAGLISLTIIWDGWHNLRQVLGDLMDENPSKLGSHELEDLPRRIRDEAESLEWVDKAAVRLREHGHALYGEVFVVPRDGADNELVTALEDARKRLCTIDWRLNSLVIAPVLSIEDDPTPETHTETRSS